MSSRIGVMSEGRLLQVGTPTEIYEQPESRFVADFIGSVTLLDGIVRAVGPDGVHLDCGALGGAVSVAGRGLRPGEAATLAIRPESITIADADEPMACANCFDGVVVSQAYAGDRHLYQVRLAQGQIIQVAAINRGDLGSKLRRDQAVVIGWPASAGRLVR